MAVTWSGASVSAPSRARARAQSMVSATPGGLYRPISRTAAAAQATWRARVSLASGTRSRMMSVSRGWSGWSTQWYRHRRLRASWTSRVRLEVTTTTGGSAAAKVPISGTVTE